MTTNHTYPVITLPASGDNFIYLCQYQQDKSFAIDPCDASSVLATLKQNNLKLTDILITHHHWDHTAGIQILKNKTTCTVIGPDKRRIPAIDKVIKDGQILQIDSARIKIISTPGHTLTSVCYYLLPTDETNPGLLWTGDTLFVNGCGRILESDAETMLNSLQKLASLPDNTLVYCGHDYTLENYQFALTIELENKAIQKRLREVTEAISQGKFTVPSTIYQEKLTNPFLNPDRPEIKSALNMPNAKPAEIFAKLRKQKDFF